MVILLAFKVCSRSSREIIVRVEGLYKKVYCAKRFIERFIMHNYVDNRLRRFGPDPANGGQMN